MAKNQQRTIENKTLSNKTAVTTTTTEKHSLTSMIYRFFVHLMALVSTKIKQPQKMDSNLHTHTNTHSVAEL